MSDAVTRMDIVHSAVGGGICFLGTILLSSLVNILIQRILIALGILTVTVFENFVIAKAAISFALIYLICGFLGGLYTGYFVENNLKILLPLTGGIGFTGFTVVLIFYGGLDLTVNFLEMIILPLLGDIIGAYLGGYTISWPSEGEEEVDEEISLNLEQ